MRNVVILTGAGISAESGIKTFRDSNGLWENHRIEDVATPAAFRRNPKLVHEFYNARRRQLQDPVLQPNGAHMALAKLENNWRGSSLLITQNVDNLHERAGSKNLIHMHGELLKVRCEKCADIWEESGDISTETCCKNCGANRGVRPQIVWFEEMPLCLEEIYVALRRCDLFASIGTSGAVYPAAGFVDLLPRSAKKLEFNLARSEISDRFDENIFGKASVTVAKWVEDLLAG